MKNDKIVDAFNAIQPSDVVKNRIFEKAMQKQHKKHLVFKMAVSLAATAAVICLVVFGSMLLSPQSDNIFTLRAYAMEQLSDGSFALREVDLLNETHYGFAYIDGVFYVNANLKCEGENIKSVDFYTDDGFFAKQYLTIENGKIVTEDGVPAIYIKSSDDDEHFLAMYGDDFDIIGNHFILDNGAMTDGFLLFLGMEVADWREKPSQMIIRAVATFNDGKRQEQMVTLELANEEFMGLGMIKPSPEDIAKMNAESEKYQTLLHSTPLEKCEVITDSVQLLTYGDTFEYSIPSGRVSGTCYYPITEEAINSAISENLFDANGVCRQGSNLPTDGSDGYIAVIKDNGDGTFTGMVYKVPGELILETMK